jgi:hypothetical protein
MAIHIDLILDDQWHDMGNNIFLMPFRVFINNLRIKNLNHSY